MPWRVVRAGLAEFSTGTAARKEESQRQQGPYGGRVNAAWGALVIRWGRAGRGPPALALNLAEGEKSAVRDQEICVGRDVKRIRPAPRKENCKPGAPRVRPPRPLVKKGQRDPGKINRIEEGQVTLWRANGGEYRPNRPAQAARPPGDRRAALGVPQRNCRNPSRATRQDGKKKNHPSGRQGFAIGRSRGKTMHGVHVGRGWGSRERKSRQIIIGRCPTGASEAAQ